ncbi:hypothetical protein I2750_22105 [Bacillus sp. PR5]|nr:hypothetical protein [Bacillus sp. PR5]
MRLEHHRDANRANCGVRGIIPNGRQASITYPLADKCSRASSRRIEELDSELVG